MYAHVENLSSSPYAECVNRFVDFSRYTKVVHDLNQVFTDARDPALKCERALEIFVLTLRLTEVSVDEREECPGICEIGVQLRRPYAEGPLPGWAGYS
jgi:hypothetical protein